MKKIILLFLLFISSYTFAQSWSLQTTISGASGGFNSVCAVNANVCWICGTASQVYKTTNGGINWVDVHGNIVGMDGYSIFALDDQHAWIGAGDGTIYRTVNGGTNWVYAFPLPASPFIDVVHMFDMNKGFALGDPASSQWRYYITMDGGITYALGANTPSAANSTEAGWANSYMALDTGHIWWGSNNNRIYHGGWKGLITYSTVSALNQFGIAMADSCNGVVICVNGNPPSTPAPNIRITNCASYSGYTPPSIPYGIKCEPKPGAYEYWISGASGIYYSSDNGTNWSTQFSVTSAAYCISMVSSIRGWAGGATGQIWRYNGPGDGLIKENNEVPLNYSLLQNYPNPFNPTTTINFALPNADYVKLAVYDILGNEITVLVNEKMNAGNYHVEFDGTKLPSGVYFYKLSATGGAGQFTESKKMILAK